MDSRNQTERGVSYTQWVCGSSGQRREIPVEAAFLLPGIMVVQCYASTTPVAAAAPATAVTPSLRLATLSMIPLMAIMVASYN